jgi:hypothetical protein
MATSLCSRLSEIAPEKFEQLDEEQIIALKEAALKERYARIDAACGGLDLDERGWARTDRGPLFWAQNHTRTENPHYIEEGLPFKAPFPMKEYFQPLFGAMMQETRLFIPKTRQMLTSWAVMVHGTQKAQWHKAEVIIQTENEEKAKRLVEYAQILYDNQDDHLKKLHPLKGRSQLSIEWQDGGRVFGIPAGESKIRMFHATLYIMDEAAFLPEAEQCYNAAHPVCRQIIAISSAGPGWFGDECQAQEEPEKSLSMERILKHVEERYPYPIDRQHC